MTPEDGDTTMITKEIAVSLHHRQTLYHIKMKNADGSPLRCRVNGKCLTWKRRVHDFQLPVKHGLKKCFHINGDNRGLHSASDPEMWSTEETCQLAIALGLDPDIPAGIIADYLEEHGRPEDAAHVRRGVYHRVVV